MKRLFSLLLLLALGLSLLACNAPRTNPNTEVTTPEVTTPEETTPEITTPEETTPDNSTPPSPEPDKIHITFYHTMGESLRALLNKYIAEFNKLYPNIVIEHKKVGGYDDVRDQIQVEITVGDQPNIAYCYPDHVATYNVVNAVQTLDEFINSTETITRADGTTETIGLTQEQLDNFIDGFYAEGSIYGDGKMYTMPMSKSADVLYYNKTFFEENNIKVPTTWNEMEEVCAQIKQLDPNCTPLAYDSAANWFITMCAQLNSPYTSATGDNHFLFNNETNRNFVARFRTWYEKGYVTTREILGNYTSALFANGTCYMNIASSAEAEYQNDDGNCEFEVGIVSVPQVDLEAPKTIFQGPSLCIFKKSNEAEVRASWLFVKFLTTNLNFQAEFGMTSGYIPVLENVTDNAVYAEKLEIANGYEKLPYLAAKITLEQADAYFAPPAFVGSAAAYDEVDKLMEFCMTDPSAATASGIQAAFKDAIYECLYQAGY